MESHTCVICLSDNEIDRIERWECKNKCFFYLCIECWLDIKKCPYCKKQRHYKIPQKSKFYRELYLF